MRIRRALQLLEREGLEKKNVEVGLLQSLRDEVEKLQRRSCCFRQRG